MQLHFKVSHHSFCKFSYFYVLFVIMLLSGTKGGKDNLVRGFYACATYS